MQMEQFLEAALISESNYNCKNLISSGWFVKRRYFHPNNVSRSEKIWFFQGKKIIPYKTLIQLELVQVHKIPILIQILYIIGD